MKTAQESGSWSRVFAYDAYGNRCVESANHTLTFATPTASSQFNAANNRISQNFNGQGTPPAYDAAGNLTSHLHIGAMAYDAENHQASFTGASGTTTYQYDGDGRRLKKLQGTRTTVFVYDAFGNLAAEYDTQPAPNLMAGAYYRTTDHQGSTRLVTDANGAVVSRRDFFPFGEQIDDTWGNRQLVTDGNTFTTYNKEFGVHQKFTGKERDGESSLDFFGARYMSAAQGRFTSPDKPFADQHPEDSQSWNLYAYVRNNPLAHVDTNGQACFALNSGSAFCGRATEYGQIDARVSGQTRFFAAASAVSQALANSDIGYGGFISRAMPQISGSTQQFLNQVGHELLVEVNRPAAADVQSGKLSGPDLDARMVNMEQSKVQESLDSLKKPDPAAYETLIEESNAGLNPSDAMRRVGSLKATDKAYLGVLDGVRKQLGRNIDFRIQSDREAIGNALIQHIRQQGGCDVTGDKVTVCH